MTRQIKGRESSAFAEVFALTAFFPHGKIIAEQKESGEKL